MTASGDFDPVRRPGPEGKSLSEPAVRHNVAASAILAKNERALFSSLTWLAGFQRNLMLIPEGKWLVECDGDLLRATDDKQNAKLVAKSDLTGVVIETNDSGPWGQNTFRQPTGLEQWLLTHDFEDCATCDIFGND